MKLKIKNKKIKIILFIIAILVILLIGFIMGKFSSSNKMSRNMKNMLNETSSTSNIVEETVGTQTIENTLTSSGQIKTSETEKLSLTTSYYFKQMCAEEDDIVLEGENILQYSNGKYLTADYDCVISSYSVPESGKICTSSNYVEVQNLKELTMTLSIDENEINSVQVGQEVEIELNAFEDKTYTGQISKIDSVGTYSSSGTTFTATVEFENDGNVKIGMSASCSIIIEKAENVIAVPIEAIQTSNDNKYVVVVKEDGTTENVNVETGISNDSYVEIKSGLSGGEKIQMISISNNKSSGFGGGMNLPSGEKNSKDGNNMSNMGNPPDMQGGSNQKGKSGSQAMPGMN